MWSLETDKILNREGISIAMFKQQFTNPYGFLRCRFIEPNPSSLPSWSLDEKKEKCITIAGVVDSCLLGSNADASIGLVLAETVIIA